MADLLFDVEGVQAERFSASPLLLFKLRLTDAEPHRRIENVLLDCQIRIEPTQRRYNARERERLSELFGPPESWSQTVHSMLWTHAHIAVPAFFAETTVELPAHCTHDFALASAKYFYGLTEGEAPLSFLFSGSLFEKDADGVLQIAQIPWSKEAGFRLPASLWRELMNAHYPDCELLRLGSQTFDRLYQYKRRRGLLSFDDALNELLQNEEAGAR